MNKSFINKLIVIILCSLFSGLTSLTAQNENKGISWNESIDCLRENISMLDQKTYDENGELLKIYNYQMEKDKLYVSTWLNLTKKKHIEIFDLRQLEKIEFECNEFCVLTLSFNSNAEEYQEITISNCEVRSQKEKNCLRNTWTKDDDFILKTRQAFKQISYLNSNARN